MEEGTREETGQFWAVLAPEILVRLTTEDDPAFWEAAIDTVLAEASFLYQGAGTPGAFLVRIGACSHWLRPHQTRWTADSGFAWPTGYGGSGFSRLGLPELDWSITCRWDDGRGGWVPAGSPAGACLLFRAALPTRTARHRQAAIHTVWMPGSPIRPKEEALQFYGFRKKKGDWVCTAYRGDENLYERAAEGNRSEGSCRD
jgi:hypothetical protein